MAKGKEKQAPEQQGNEYVSLWPMSRGVAPVSMQACGQCHSPALD